METELTEAQRLALLDDIEDALKSRPDLYVRAQLPLLRARLLATTPPLTYAQLEELHVLVLGNDPSTKKKKVNADLGVLGAAHSYDHYLGGMSLAFRLTAEQAVALATQEQSVALATNSSRCLWRYDNVSPKKDAEIPRIKKHVARNVLRQIAEGSRDAKSAGTTLIVLGYGAWPDHLQDVRFEHTALLSRDAAGRGAMKLETHEGTNLVLVKFQDTKIEFLFCGYPHPGSSGVAGDLARAPIYASFLRKAMTLQRSSEVTVPCPSALAAWSSVAMETDEVEPSAAPSPAAAAPRRSGRVRHAPARPPAAMDDDDDDDDDEEEDDDEEGEEDDDEQGDY